jgi:hypothetical protein
MIKVLAISGNSGIFSFFQKKKKSPQPPRFLGGNFCHIFPIKVLTISGNSGNFLGFILGVVNIFGGSTFSGGPIFWGVNFLGESKGGGGFRVVAIFVNWIQILKISQA